MENFQNKKQLVENQQIADRSYEIWEMTESIKESNRRMDILLKKFDDKLNELLDIVEEKVL